MAVSVTSPADMVNLALARIGYKLRVGSLFDGSPAASAALSIYGQTRDAVLCESEWDFAQRMVALTLLKTAPTGGYIPPTAWSSTYPPLGWIYEYAYPSDALNVRSLRSAPLFIPNFDPRPNTFQVVNDASLTPPAKVIVTNLPDAIAVYTGRVTDPASWKPSFVEALAAALARRLAPVLGSLDVAKMEAQDEQTATAIAATIQG